MFSTQHQTHSRPRPPSLAEIIREETDDGRLLVRVLRDIADGRIEDTKPHHRYAAARELLARGFDEVPEHSGRGGDEDGVVASTAASTAAEELQETSGDVTGSDRPSEVAVAAEPAIDPPSENTDPAVEEPDQSREETVAAGLDTGQSSEEPGRAVPVAGQPDEEPGPAEPDTGQVPEEPDPELARPRMSVRARRGQRIRNRRRSKEISDLLNDGAGDSQHEVDGVVAAGFR